MSLRIYNNPSVLNTHRNLINNAKSVEKSFEKVSSGLKINRAADSPASLVISERLRSQIASIEQAVNNTSTDISVLQTAEASLAEINNTLVHMRQLAVHAANEGANDQYALEADQNEIEEALNSIDRVVRNTSFGAKKLLDGSAGINGMTTNPLMEFVTGNPNTKQSSDGYEVQITATATKSVLVGTDNLSQDLIDSGETLRIIENGKVAEYTTNFEDNLLSVVSKLNNSINRNGLDVEVSLSDNNKLVIQHKYFGSKYDFYASSTTSGVLSQDEGSVTQALKGLDVAGFINGEAARGEGQVLTGVTGSPNVDGLAIRYLGTEGGLFGDEINDTIFAGKVFLTQKSLIFQTGPDFGQTTRVAINNINTENMGRGIENQSEFRRLRDINVLSHQTASDSMLLLDESISQVTLLRGKIGAVQKNDLETGLRSMRTYRENLVAAESLIRDSDYAEEISELTKRQVLQSASMSVLAQNNRNMQSVLTLLA